MDNIDNKIRELLTVVENKKNDVAKAKKEAERKWKTNCAVEGFNNTVINLTTANRDQVIKATTLLLQMRNARQEALNLLGISDSNDSYMGYSYDEWFEDCKKRIAVVELQDKIKNLNEAETRLNAIISPEQRRQFELEALTKMLG